MVKNYPTLKKLAPLFFLLVSITAFSQQYRYIRIQKSGTNTTNYINLAEIQIIDIDGVTNRSLVGTATLSSTYPGGGANRGNDNNTDGNWSNNSVFHSAGTDTNEWWEIDLGALYSLSKINIYNRTDCCGDRLSNMYVMASDTPFNTSGSNAANLTAALANSDFTYQFGGVTTSAMQVVTFYCSSIGNNSAQEWIDYVAFGGMTNATGNDGGYKDYTSNVATVTIGSTYQILVSAGFSSTKFTEYWKIWIDYNQNGIFDTAEEITSGFSSSPFNLSDNITIPTDALIGQTRMRVSMKYNSAQTACETFSYGEVEDYTVNVTCSTYSLSSTAIVTTPVCAGTAANVQLNGTAANLPTGTYIVTYNLSASNTAIGNTSTMTVTTAGTGTFNTSTLANSGATTVTITNLARGSCSNSIIADGTVSVTVNPKSVGGSVTGGTTICSGSTSALLTLSGNTGSIVKWQSSVSPFSSWNNITNTTSTYASGALTQTTQFRAVVQSGVCLSANSAVTTVTVNPTSVGGSVTGGTTICSGSTSTLLTLSGNTGSIVKWQSSVSPFSSWTNITNTTSTYTSGVLTQTTQFRAVVQSGVCSPANSAFTTVTVNPTPTIAPTTTGALICIGSTATLSASGAVVGDKYKWYNAATGGTLLKTSTNNTDNIYTTAVLATTTNYWVSILNLGGCESNRTIVSATFPPNSPDSQTTAGTNTWVGNVYDGTNSGVLFNGNFTNYYGIFTESETFDESFGGNTTCFAITSSLGGRSIYTETFSVRYRMNSTRKGLYVVDLGSDDGSRLTIDGTLIYNNWSDQGWSLRPRILMSLTGNSTLLYDFYENAGGNRVNFNNLIPILSNTISTNTSQNICPGKLGDAISGDTYGTLPTGISLSGTGYQWKYSTTLGGVRNNISGATGATFTPNGSIAPFNSPGTYYVYRNAVISSANNIGASPYIATNESNVATIVINGTNTWNGSVSTDWNDALNWCAGVPTIGFPNTLDAVIPSGLTNYPIIFAGDAPGYVKTIELQSNTTLNVRENSLQVTNNLTLNGIIDLEGESQLLQDMGSTFDPLSTGSIEIDQQGEGNKYRYNYWSMPVNTLNDGNNYTTIFASLRDGTVPSSPAPIIFKNSGYDGALTTPITLSTYWMFKYANSGSGYSAWNQIRSTGKVYAGQGFTLKGPGAPGSPAQNYVFVGKPNNGTINLTVAANYGYLVGNPYPSALDADQFILDNALSITGAIYFWEHYGGDTHNLAGYQGGYATYNIGGGVQASAFPGLAGGISVKGAPGPFIPVGQAFFVVGDAVDGGQIQFNNGQRIFEKESPDSSVFMKSSNTKSKTANSAHEDLRPKFRIGYDAPKISHRQLLLTIDERATPNVDWGFDAEIYEIFADDMYWMLEGEKYVIQATNAIGLNSEVPLGIQLSKTGMVTVKIDALENVDDDTSIYLKDKLTGETFNMREKAVQLNLTAGKYTDRFVIVFKTQKLVAEDVKAEVLVPAIAQPIIEGIHVFMNNTMKELQIKNNSTEEITSVALRNSLGQTVRTWNSNFNRRTISLPVNTATGVYVVQIITKNGLVVQKVIVE